MLQGFTDIEQASFGVIRDLDVHAADKTLALDLDLDLEEGIHLQHARHEVLPLQKPPVQDSTLSRLCTCH